MICSIQTLGITGIQGSAVVAECYISNGLPGFDIVGLPDAAVKLEVPSEVSGYVGSGCVPRRKAAIWPFRSAGLR